MWSSELTRRGILRVGTSLLNLIIGPAGAWRALGFQGLCVYAAIHTLSKTGSAEASARSRANAMVGYRTSPAMLFIGGALPFLGLDWWAPVILVPFFLGSFEGAFWTTFHEIRSARVAGEGAAERGKGAEGSEDEDSLEWFQKVEIVATIIAALLVFWLESEGVTHYASILGSSMAIAAFAMPMNESAKTVKLGLSVSDLRLERAVAGGITTGSFGVIQLVTPWAMRLFCLEEGGISLLAQFVALATLIGFLVSHYIKKTEESKEAALRKNWRIGYFLCSLGFLLMSTGVVMEDLSAFTAGYLVCVAGMSGILRPLEIKIAGDLFKGEGGSIGLRERVKFRTQTKFLLGYSLLVMALFSFGIDVFSDLSIILIPGLAFCIGLCALELRIFNVLDSLRRARPRD